MVRTKLGSMTRWAALVAVSAFGAVGCAGGEGAASTTQATVVAGAPRADGLRAYWRFERGGAACIVRAASESSAQASACPAVTLAAPGGELTGAASGSLSSVAYGTTDPPEEETLRAVSGDHTDLSSIGIGNGGR